MRVPLPGWRFADAGHIHFVTAEQGARISVNASRVVEAGGTLSPLLPLAADYLEGVATSGDE